MRLNIAICDDDKSFMENLEKMLISYSLHRLTRAHSPLSCAMDK